MDEVLRRKGLWIGVAVLGVIFLCVIVCALGPLLMLMPRQVVTYVQPPVAGEGAVVTHQGGPGLLGIAGEGFRLLLRLVFFGLLLVLGLRLVRHLFWGPRHWFAPYWGPYYQGRPSKGTAGDTPEGDEGYAAWRRPRWGHHGWRCHPRHWGPPPGWTPRREEAGDEPAADAPENEYTGPQE